jgi:hypothetical protein
MTRTPRWLVWWLMAHSVLISARAIRGSWLGCGLLLSAEEFEIRPEPDRMPGLDFVRLDESEQAKSRLHLDFRM